MALGLLLIRCDFFYRKMKKRSNFRKVVTWSIIISIISIIAIVKLITSSNHPMAITKSYIYIEPINSFFRRKPHNGTRDWNDYNKIKVGSARKGPGEMGEAVFTDSDNPSQKELDLLDLNGHNVMVSDMISLDRMIPDLRSPECKGMHYLKKLPTVSIIIPFYDEHPTTIMRTVHSVVNRAPHHLLKEVILVNDASTQKDLFNDLRYHFRTQAWGAKVKMFMMPERSGPNWSRLAGARSASGDVLLFLDCHVEAGHNYLPPLIEPIVSNIRTVVTPTLDIIDKRTYEIRPLGIGRTVFDWNFHAQRIPFHSDHEVSGTFKTPIMYGAAFAISAKFFWELQPDSGLKIYGGDQLEMSFKINLCGGVLTEAPCSRIAHLYRRFPYKKHQHDVDYKARNNKRVAEIWLGEYKKYLYRRHPDRYRSVDAGDISRQIALKKNLQCKPFSYFFEEIAPDMLQRFPFLDHEHFASGTIRNKEINKCIQTVDKDHGGKVILSTCSHNKTNPHHQQFFTLRHFRDIMIHGKSDCLEGSSHGVNYARCHYEQGNQYFRYDLETFHIIWGRKRNNLCIDANPESDNVFINFCDKDKPTQKWVWGFAKMSALKNWINFGEPISDKQEIKDLLEPTEHRAMLPKNSSSVSKKEVHDETEKEEDHKPRRAFRKAVVKHVDNLESMHKAEAHEVHKSNGHVKPVEHHEIHKPEDHHAAHEDPLDVLKTTDHTVVIAAMDHDPLKHHEMNQPVGQQAEHAKPVEHHEVHHPVEHHEVHVKPVEHHEVHAKPVEHHEVHHPVEHHEVHAKPVEHHEVHHPVEHHEVHAKPVEHHEVHHPVEHNVQHVNPVEHHEVHHPVEHNVQHANPVEHHEVHVKPVEHHEVHHPVEHIDQHAKPVDHHQTETHH